MKVELLLLGITIFFIVNTYYDNKYIEILKSWKKYYQMFGIGFIGISTYVFLKKYPEQSMSLFTYGNNFIKYLPIDKDTTNFITPILDLAKNNYSNSFDNNQMYQERKILNSGNSGFNAGYVNTELIQPRDKNTKRSVSETKKKYVASSQDWKCFSCKQQLNAWFEVDHKIRLDSGGSNHVDNLVALCRNCHGKKTTLENL